MIHWVWSYYVFTHLEIIILLKTLIGLYCELCFQNKNILKENTRYQQDIYFIKKKKQGKTLLHTEQNSDQTVY